MRVLFCFFIFQFFSLLASADCASLVTDLKAMKQANKTIQQSLISNHALFASTLESYSDALTESAGRAHRTLSMSMSSSADSYRERGLKAQKMMNQLDEASAELIQKISKCLK